MHESLSRSSLILIFFCLVSIPIPIPLSILMPKKQLSNQINPAK